MNELEIQRIDKKEFKDEELRVIGELFEDNLLYTAALKEMQTRVEILRDDFRQNNAYNPIEHIKVRIKTPTSILKKVVVRDIPLTVEDIKKELNDIVGIRVVCTFKSDIYDIAEILRKSEDIKVLQIKDYIANPKPSGYQSYHMIVEIPVYMAHGKRMCKVEIQLRTMAMDFWASLEHKIKYKYDWKVPTDIREELFDCSKVVDTLDDKMLRLHKRVHDPHEMQIETNL